MNRKTPTVRQHTVRPVDTEIWIFSASKKILLIFNNYVKVVTIKEKYSTMSLCYVQSESLTSRVTVSVWCDGMEE